MQPSARTPTDGTAANSVMVFVGVTTGGSLINRIFPLWADIMGIAPAMLRGMDLPLDVGPKRIRQAIREIADDPAVRGSLVTTHKVAVYRHARDLFCGVDPYADRLGEVSALAKTPAGLVGHAMDPVTAGLALDRIVAPAHWSERPQAEALVMGAGGAGLALVAHMAERPAAERPRAITLSDVDEERISDARSALSTFGGREIIGIQRVGSATDNDRLLAALPASSLVVNATGLGKDRPGSPISEAAVFPDAGIVWEFNYRGPREFLAQARARQSECRLTVADGWTYFVYGWAHVVAEVFGVVLDDPLFTRLEQAAQLVRDAQTPS